MVDIIYYGKDDELERKGFNSECQYEKWLDENPNICVLIQTPKTK